MRKSFWRLMVWGLALAGFLMPGWWSVFWSGQAGETAVAAECGRVVARPAISGSVSRMIISGNYAYVTVPGAGLKVLDISNPAASTVAAELSFSPEEQRGAGYEVQPGVFGLGIYGQHAYVGRYFGFNIVDISNPRQPRDLGYRYVGGSSFGPMIFSDVVIGGRTMIVMGAVRYPPVFNLANPANPVFVSTAILGQYSLSGSSLINRVHARDDAIYLTTAEGGFAVDADNPVNRNGTLNITGSFLLTNNLGGAEGAYPDESENVYTVSFLRLSVFRSADRFRMADKPELGGSDVYVSGGRAYVISSNGLKVVDVSDPEQPTLLTTANVAGSKIEGNGDYLYVFGGQGGPALSIVNISDCSSLSGDGGGGQDGDGVVTTMVVSSVFPDTLNISDDNIILIHGQGFTNPVLSFPGITFSNLEVNADGTVVRAVARVGAVGAGTGSIVVTEGQDRAEVNVSFRVKQAEDPVITGTSISAIDRDQRGELIIHGRNFADIESVEVDGIGASVTGFSVENGDLKVGLIFDEPLPGGGGGSIPLAIFSHDDGTLVANRDAWNFSLTNAQPGDTLAVEAAKDDINIGRIVLCRVKEGENSCQSTGAPTEKDIGVWTEEVLINDQPSGQIKVTVIAGQTDGTNDSRPLQTKTAYQFSGLSSGVVKEGNRFVYKDFAIVANYFGDERATIGVRLTDDQGLDYTYTKDNLDAPLVIDGQGSKKTVLLNVAGVAFPANDENFEYHPNINVEVTADQPIYVLPPTSFSTSGTGNTVAEVTEEAWQKFGFSPPGFVDRRTKTEYFPYAIFWRNLRAFPDGWDSRIRLSNVRDRAVSVTLNYFPDYNKTYNPNTCLDHVLPGAVQKELTLQPGETRVVYLRDILDSSLAQSHQTEGMLSFEFTRDDPDDLDIGVEVVPLSGGRRICADDAFLNPHPLNVQLIRSVLAAERSNFNPGLAEVRNRRGGRDQVPVDAPRIAFGGENTDDKSNDKTDSSSFSFKIDNPFKGGAENVIDVLAILATFIFQLGIPVAVVIIIYSGITILVSADRPAVYQRGLNGLKWAAIGLAVLLVGKGFVSLIQSILSVK